MNELDRAMEEIGSKIDNPLFAIAYGLLMLADSQNETARAIHLLGNANADTPMGAIEAFGKHIGEKMDNLAYAIEGIVGKME